MSAYKLTLVDVNKALMKPILIDDDHFDGNRLKEFWFDPLIKRFYIKVDGKLVGKIHSQASALLDRYNQVGAKYSFPEASVYKGESGNAMQKEPTLSDNYSLITEDAIKNAQMRQEDDRPETDKERQFREKNESAPTEEALDVEIPEVTHCDFKGRMGWMG